MKIKIHDDKAVGILYYDHYDFYEKMHRNSEYFDILLKECDLTAYEYVDIINNISFIQLYGSITNMLRFRNALKFYFNLKELEKWR